MPKKESRLIYGLELTGKFDCCPTYAKDISFLFFVFFFWLATGETDNERDHSKDCGCSEDTRRIKQKQNNQNNGDTRLEDSVVGAALARYSGRAKSFLPRNQLTHNAKCHFDSREGQGKWVFFIGYVQPTCEHLPPYTCPQGEPLRRGGGGGRGRPEFHRSRPGVFQSTWR